MESLALNILTAVNLMLGVTPYPASFTETWIINETWAKEGDAYVFEATTTELAKQCEAHPEMQVRFPRIIHSAHEIYVDSRLIYKVGDKTFRKASPFYFQPALDCRDVVSGKTLKWRVYAYSKYFARFAKTPTLTAGHTANLSNVTANTVATGVIIVISLFSLMISLGRVPNALSFSVSIGGLLLSSYFLNVVNSDLGLELSMLTSHKLADLGLWVGGSLIFYGLYLSRVFSSWMYFSLLISTALGSAIVLTGSSGDIVQFGTIIPMAPFLVCSIVAIHRLLFSGFEKGFDRHNQTRLFSLTFFFITGNNDLLNIFGIIEGPMLLSVGIVGAVFGLSMAVNQEIEKTYQERDTLLTDLEEKVKEKTRNLTTALSSLQSTQAELIQSARLAALGTLSAGVAHEINNSINYVNGALKPLERHFLTKIPEADRPRAQKLFDAIKEGTELTVEIVKSLRNYTGLNQAAVKEVVLAEVVNTVLTILKTKLRGISVKVDVPNDAIILGSTVGINQVVMNLVTNAIDAMPAEAPSLSISVKVSDHDAVIAVQDNGAGIPTAVQDRIFDPFYTTKEVGRGTGLGLHIVKKEIEKHGGKIDIQSTPGQGSTFSVTFPLRPSNLNEESAA